MATSDINQKLDLLMFECLLKSSDILLARSAATILPSENMRLQLPAQRSINEYCSCALAPWKHKVTSPLTIDLFTTTSTSRHVLVERWTFNYIKRDEKEIRISLGAINRRVVTFLRTLYSFVRLLPSFQILRFVPNVPVINFEIYNPEIFSAAKVDLETYNYDFPVIGTSRGSLSVSVKYLSNENLQQIFFVKTNMATFAPASKMLDVDRSNSKGHRANRNSGGQISIPIPIPTKRGLQAGQDHAPVNREVSNSEVKPGDNAMRQYRSHSVSELPQTKSTAATPSSPLQQHGSEAERLIFVAEKERKGTDKGQREPLFGLYHPSIRDAGQLSPSAPPRARSLDSEPSALLHNMAAMGGHIGRPFGAAQAYRAPRTPPQTATQIAHLTHHYNAHSRSRAQSIAKSDSSDVFGIDYGAFDSSPRRKDASPQTVTSASSSVSPPFFLANQKEKAGLPSMPPLSPYSNSLPRAAMSSQQKQQQRQPYVVSTPGSSPGDNLSGVSPPFSRTSANLVSTSPQTATALVAMQSFREGLTGYPSPVPKKAIAGAAGVNPQIGWTADASAKGLEPSDMYKEIALRVKLPSSPFDFLLPPQSVAEDGTVRRLTSTSEAETAVTERCDEGMGGRTSSLLHPAVLESLKKGQDINNSVSFDEQDDSTRDEDDMPFAWASPSPATKFSNRDEPVTRPRAMVSIDGCKEEEDEGVHSAPQGKNFRASEWADGTDKVPSLASLPTFDSLNIGCGVPLTYKFLSDSIAESKMFRDYFVAVSAENM